MNALDIITLAVGIVAVVVSVVAVGSVIEAVVYDIRNLDRTPVMYKVHVRLVHGYWPKDNKR